MHSRRVVAVLVVALLLSAGIAEAQQKVKVGVLKLTFTACLAFGTSTATLVSQCLGSGKADEAEQFGWTSVRLGLLIFGVVGLLVSHGARPSATARGSPGAPREARAPRPPRS